MWIKKKFLWALFMMFTLVSFSSCNFEGVDDDDDDDSSWSALCKDNQWLYEFPKFTGDYQTAYAAERFDNVTITIDGVEDGEDEFRKYAKKLVADGFRKNSEYDYSKDINGRTYSVQSSNGVIYIVFSKVEM